jgi:hypothetical protein
MLVCLFGGLIIGFPITLWLKSRAPAARRWGIAGLWLLLLLPMGALLWGGSGPGATRGLYYAYLFLGGMAMFPTLLLALTASDRERTDPP